MSFRRATCTGMALLLVGTLMTSKIIDYRSRDLNRQLDGYYLSDKSANILSNALLTENEVTNTDDYYVKHDQLILDELDLEVKDNMLIRTKKSDSLNATSQLKSLNSSINKNSGFEKRLVKIISDEQQKNRNIAAIGVSTIFFENSTDTEVKDLEPLKYTDFENFVVNERGNNVFDKSFDANDLLIQTAGTPTEYGSLTLSIVVSIDNWNTDLAFATSYSDWNPSLTEELFGSDKIKPDPENTDYVTLTNPSCYYMYSEALSGTCTDKFREMKTYSSVIYGFDEHNGRTTLSTAGELSSTPSGVREWTTTYLHTWETIAPSFSISSTGVSISGTPSDKSWQLTSYIRY